MLLSAPRGSVLMLVAGAASGTKHILGLGPTLRTRLMQVILRPDRCRSRIRVVWCRNASWTPWVGRGLIPRTTGTRRSSLGVSIPTHHFGTGFSAHPNESVNSIKARQQTASSLGGFSALRASRVSPLLTLVVRRLGKLVWSIRSRARNAVVFTFGLAQDAATSPVGMDRTGNLANYAPRLSASIPSRHRSLFI